MIDPDYNTLELKFIQLMAELGALGKSKHKEKHYQFHKERPKDDNGNVRDMLEHASQHILSYRYPDTDKHELGGKEYHLAAAAFNLMMEFHFVRLEKNSSPGMWYTSNKKFVEITKEGTFVVDSVTGVREHSLVLDINGYAEEVGYITHKKRGEEKLVFAGKINVPWPPVIERVC